MSQQAGTPSGDGLPLIPVSCGLGSRLVGWCAGAAVRASLLISPWPAALLIRRIFRPLSATEPLPLVVWVHGGGFVGAPRRSWPATSSSWPATASPWWRPANHWPQASATRYHCAS